MTGAGGTQTGAPGRRSEAAGSRARHALCRTSAGPAGAGQGGSAGPAAPGKGSCVPRTRVPRRRGEAFELDESEDPLGAGPPGRASGCSPGAPGPAWVCLGRWLRGQGEGRRRSPGLGVPVPTRRDGAGRLDSDPCDAPSLGPADGSRSPGLSSSASSRSPRPRRREESPCLPTPCPCWGSPPSRWSLAPSGRAVPSDEGAGR